MLCKYKLKFLYKKLAAIDAIIKGPQMPVNRFWHARVLMCYKAIEELTKRSIGPYNNVGVSSEKQQKLVPKAK